MRKLLIAWVVVAALLGALALIQPHQAGAATPKAPTISCGSTVNGEHAKMHSLSACKGHATSGDGSHVSISIGWVIYAHFQHSEVASALASSFVVGAAAGIGSVCLGLVESPPLAAICGVFIAIFTSFFEAQFWNAYNAGEGIVLEFSWLPPFFMTGWELVPDSWT